MRIHIRIVNHLTRRCNGLVTRGTFLHLLRTKKSRHVSPTAERNEEIVRIISARKADKSERKIYEGYRHA